MKKIIAFLALIVALWVSFVFSYSLSESDIVALDRAEEKIFTLIDDTSNPYSAQVFVDLIDKALSEYELNERQQMFLEIISDDIQWEYGIWEYSEIYYEVLSEDDCYEDEYYDSENQTCYYYVGEDYDDDTEYEWWDFQWEEFWHEHSNQEESEILARYSISWNAINLISWDDAIRNQEVWNIFSALIPISARWDIVEYQISDDDNSDTAAHVEQIPWDNTNWLMNVNLSAFYEDGVLEPEESYATLIHEFAHVLTLNNDQVRYIPEYASDDVMERFSQNCDTNFLQEWCLLPWAYLNDFINEFWSDEEYTEKVRNQEVLVYEVSPDSFVTEYAATNPGEDIAESFTYFVLRAQPDGNTIADQKLRFFYNYKQLESLRKQIRSNLSQLK